MDDKNFTVVSYDKFDQKGCCIQVRQKFLSEDDFFQLAQFIKKKEDLITIDLGDLSFEKNSDQAVNYLGKAIAGKKSLKEVKSNFRFSEYNCLKLFRFYELMLSNEQLTLIDAPKEMVAQFKNEHRLIKLIKTHANKNSELRYVGGLKDIYDDYKTSFTVNRRHLLGKIMSDIRDLADVLVKKRLGLVLDYVRFVSDDRNCDLNGDFSILPSQNHLGRFQKNKSFILNELGGKNSIESYLNKLNDPFVRALNKIFSSNVLCSMMASVVRHKFDCASYFNDAQLLLNEEIITKQMQYFKKFYVNNLTLKFSKPESQEGRLTLHNREDFEKLLQKNPNHFTIDDLQSLIYQANRRHSALSIAEDEIKTDRFNDATVKKITNLSIVEDPSIVREPVQNNHYYRSRVTRSEKSARAAGIV